MVSISCTTYNHVQYIRQCLDGFLMQECNFNYEILIHDDASTDGTIDIIKEYQEKYPEIIKPYIQKENQWSKGVRGMNAKYNFSRAKGKYIALCEGDDYWTDPLKLQRQVDFLKSNEEYILSTENAIVLDSIRNTTNNFFIIKERSLNVDIFQLLEKRIFTTASVVFRNITFPQFYGGDIVMWIFLLTQGKCHFNNINSSVYRRGLQGVTENTDKYVWAEEMYKWNKSLFKILEDSNFKFDKKIFNKRNQKNYFIAFIDKWVNKDFKVAIKSFFTALYFDPFLTIKELNKLIFK